jgi:methylated-DNA-[protein]-cysteine S-methyltransferase
MDDSMVINSPLGNIRLIARDGYLLSVQFTDEGEDAGSNAPLLLEVKSQLEAYFCGSLKMFDIPVGLGGTPFQRQVWLEVNKVPYGKTVSYHKVASSLNNPGAVRAVGAANGANPLLLVIPCHRVISRTGELTGYAGGLWRKLKLLQMEARDQPGKQYNLGF